MSYSKNLIIYQFIYTLRWPIQFHKVIFNLVLYNKSPFKWLLLLFHCFLMVKFIIRNHYMKLFRQHYNPTKQKYFQFLKEKLLFYFLVKSL